MSFCDIQLIFSDTIYKSGYLYGPVLDRLAKGDAQVVLGTFPADENADRVDIDKNGIIHRIICKPEKSDLKSVWSVAAWQPEFTLFLHKYISSINTCTPPAEVHIGHVIQFSIEAGFVVAGVQVSEYPPIDIGNALNLKDYWIRQT